MQVSAIVLAAGKGRRFYRAGKAKIPKLLAKINSKPIIIYSIGVLNKHPSVREIIVVVNARNSSKIISKINQYKIGKIIRVVRGGRQRQDSVRNGLKAMHSRRGLVLIHDGARPFIDKKLISSLIWQAQRSGAAIAGVPVKATIKQLKAQSPKPKGKLLVEKTLNRDNLWEIQTPQVFRKDLILKAFSKFGNLKVTDDSMLVEKLGTQVSIVLGSYNNIKITTPEDLLLAEAIAKRWNTK